jgi:hypothetical protein
MTAGDAIGHEAIVRIALLVLLVALGLGVASALGCGRSSLLDDLSSQSPGGSGASSGAGPAGGSGTPGGDGGGRGDLDATIGADDGGAGSTSKDAQSPGVCNPFTCPLGCCLGDGTCFVPTFAADGTFPTDIPCGSSGEACVTCASGDTCMAGGCVHNTAETCSPDNCDGCCILSMSSPAPGLMVSSVSCFEGSQDLYCGSGGVQCQSCAPSTNGGHCAAGPGSGGHCEDVGTCNATNCQGCCSGKLCVVGTQDVGCGSAGSACQDCTGDAGLCLGFTTPDGGTDRFCAYECLNTSPPPACNLYCLSPTECYSGADISQHL